MPISMIAWVLVLFILNIAVFIFWVKTKDKRGTCVFTDGSVFLVCSLVVIIADLSAAMSLVFSYLI